MTTEIQTYDFEDNAVRSFVDDAGETWWMATDVCRCLEIKNTPQAVAALDDDEVSIISSDTYAFNPTPGSEPTFINEPGLYSLILRSRKPAAKRFKRWVTHDVLPALRKSGRYETAPVIQASPLGHGMTLTKAHVEGLLDHKTLRIAAIVRGLSRDGEAHNAWEIVDMSGYTLHTVKRCLNLLVLIGCLELIDAKGQSLTPVSSR